MTVLTMNSKFKKLQRTWQHLEDRSWVTIETNSQNLDFEDKTRIFDTFNLYPFYNS